MTITVNRKWYKSVLKVIYVTISIVINCVRFSLSENVNSPVCFVLFMVLRTVAFIRNSRGAKLKRFKPCVVYTAEQNKSGHFCDFANANLWTVVGRFA